METNLNETAAVGYNPPQSSLLNNALRYGIYTGIAYVVVSLLFYSLGLSTKPWVGYSSYVVVIVGIVMGTLAYRDKHSNGFISYGRALASGVLISLFTGVIMGIYAYVFFGFFDPEMMGKMLDIAAENMAKKGMTDEQIDAGLKFTSRFMTPPIIAATSVLSLAFWGTIFSLITSIFIKREDNSFDAAFPES